MSEYIEINPDILSGSPVFRGTRVLVQSLFDYLEGGDSIDEFLSDFPTVSRSQVTGLLEGLKREAIPDTEAAWKFLSMNVFRKDLLSYSKVMK